MKLDLKIEALLFFKSEAMKIKDIVKILKSDEEGIQNAINELKNKLSNRGVQLIQNDDDIMLATRPEMSELIEEIRKEELIKDIGKAGAETLAIVLYKGPITRAEIDYIRGVNSTFILRNLLIRGMIEKISNPNNQRSFLYKSTPQLLAFLGVRSAKEMPEFDKVQDELNKFVGLEEKKRRHEIKLI